MCGINGFLDFNKQATREDLSAMNKVLMHRGPDGKGSKIFEKGKFTLGLGHRRLSVIDLSNAGEQPMLFEEFAISYNGELYNYTEIKSELTILGHSFQGDSDTEVILHAFKEWGVECLNRFIGMFAFVLFDQKEEVLFCARDRTGIKPFFYYFNDGLFLFASELKAFHQLPQFKKRINHDALSLFLQFLSFLLKFNIFY
jgi:asparagine synthase (glutamine-hydrolysing)